MSSKVNLSKEQLKKLYLKEKLTTYEISDKIGCCQATVWKRLKLFKIKSRPSNVLKVNLSKKELHKLYIKEKLSTWRIEKKTGMPRGTVHKKLKEFGIKTRDLADSHIIFPRKNFSGDPLEKAYLIGFRIGDLGVRKIYPNSKTICVATGSTIIEQINLVKGLFQKYGNVWISKRKNNKINTYVNLNESFDFLLTKDPPEFIFKDKDLFFSFLAGFTDAEGCMTLSNKMAYYQLGNYDHKLLNKIHRNLIKFGIRSVRIRHDNRKGKKNNQGYRYNADYYSLTIYRKKELLKLLLAIKPYIRHENKVKALNIALENIYMRDNKQK